MISLDIKKTILLSYQETLSENNHRYRSWEYCYDSFNRLLAGGCDLDYAALNLAFYLASWGMYRGSSQLLQKDYRIHIPILEVLIMSPNRIFQNLNIENYLTDSEYIETLFDLVSEIRSVYRDSGISPTDTLVTKVLLGTFCCTPAYDSLFKWGVSVWNGREDLPVNQRITQLFGFNSIKDLTRTYLTNIRDFQSASDYISLHGVLYPPMKLVDMYFWNLGYY